MPIEYFMENEETSLQELPATDPGELTWFMDFANGALKRVIGIEAPLHDIGAIVHIVDDKEVLETVCPANISDVFSDKTGVGWIPPDGTHSVELSDRHGKVSILIMKHTLPFSITTN
ncbi:hypothetical protein HYS84_01030 [Candidatus Saccharibacteria bacterium]|nr:hypothetical protein [Candidatus Saccharibacteria bacterium]